MTLGIGLTKQEFKSILPKFTLTEKKRILNKYNSWLKILSAEHEVKN